MIRHSINHDQVKPMKALCQCGHAHWQHEWEAKCNARVKIPGFNEKWICNCQNFVLKKLVDPIEAIKFRMEQMGWGQIDLVKAGCGSRSHVSEVMNRKRKLNLTFIRAYNRIADATPLEVLIQDYKL